MPLTIAYGWSLSAQRNARTDMTAEDSVELLRATTCLASAYISSNAVPTSEIPQIKTDINTSIARPGQTVPESAPMRPGDLIRTTVTYEEILSIARGNPKPNRK